MAKIAAFDVAKTLPYPGYALGTPEGLAGVVAGDEVITEIEGIGSLKNTIIGDPEEPTHVG